MRYQKLELHISQVERAILLCNSNFPEGRKKEIYDHLILIFERIKSSNYREFKANDLDFTRHALDVIFYGVQHLHYADEKEIPKRLIHCLNHVLNEWIPDGTNNYYIVISHNNHLSEFTIRAFDEGRAQAFSYYLETLFGVSYNQSLIQISKPKFLFDDYLGSTPVYHELGHFIDKNYQIITLLFKDPEFLSNNVNPSISKEHYAEHFADIFAAQYIGISAVELLNYIAYTSLSRDLPSHPSNDKRIKVVEAFLSDTGDEYSQKVVSNLKKATTDRNCPELKIRYEDLTSNPFEILTPVLIDKPQKLHSLFSQAWVSWLNENSVIRQKYSNPTECCKLINELIRDSIEITMRSKMETNN